MNLLSGNLSMRLELPLVMPLLRAFAAAESDEKNQSPPPAVEGQDSEAEGPPLKKTSIKVELNGHLIQVVETQICCTQGDVPVNATVIKMETL